MTVKRYNAIIKGQCAIIIRNIEPSFENIMRILNLFPFSQILVEIVSLDPQKEAFSRIRCNANQYKCSVIKENEVEVACFIEKEDVGDIMKSVIVEDPELIFLTYAQWSCCLVQELSESFCMRDKRNSKWFITIDRDKREIYLSFLKKEYNRVCLIKTIKNLGLV